MRNVLIVASTFGGMAAALPQKINVEAALAVPTPSILGPKPAETVAPPVTYDQAAAVASAAEAVATGGVQVKVKRNACDVQPGGAGPVPGDGSVGAYLDTTNQLRSNARSAATPSGYKKEFTDLTAATQQIGYLTYKNIDSGEYDVAACAAFCDSEKYCLGFNIFYERDPSKDSGPGCSDPAPITNVKCSIYGYPVAAASATNDGQYRGDFHVVIVGSNGYTKNGAGTCGRSAPGVSDFNPPANLPAAINAPTVKMNGQDFDSYNGMRLFNNNPYDPALCAAACESQTQFDKEHLVDSNGEYRPCNFFTSYILTKNGVPLGTYCALYTQAWSSDYAVNTGYSSDGDVYSVTCAAGYTATTQDGGKINVD